MSPSNLFTIIGGKWTTYRKMGEDLVDRIENRLQWPHKASGTAALHIHGYQKGMNWSDPLYFYGSDANAIRQSMNGSSGQWISDSLKIHKMQVQWAVEHEMARTVEDVLARRTRALLLNARESIRISRPVAEVMAQSLGKDEQWVNQQVEAYNQLAQRYILNHS